MADALAALQALIASRGARVAVMGMGYVGFPLAVALHEAGFSVIGYDIDPQKIARLEEGRSYLSDIPDAQVAAMLASKRFFPTRDDSELARADVAIICVPTPLARQHQPDLQHVITTAQALAGQLRRGQLVVLESTTYPGTTQELVLPLLETSGLICGHDFFLAYSPEREDPGNREFPLSRIPKIVAGADEASRQVACALYGAVVQQVVPVSGTATAEAVKLTENIFRSVNIAMVNELKTVFSGMGINIWEVLEAAGSKPFGYMPFYPGPGVGGHCIPVDPFYLSWKARECGTDTPLIALAGRINEAMPAYVLARLREGLAASGKMLPGARVLLLGVAYKAGVDDVRESPGLVLFDQLAQMQAQALYHDPYIPALPPTRAFSRLEGICSQPLSAALLAGCDAAIVVSGHTNIDYALVAEHCPLVVDTRNIMPRGGKARVVAA